MSEPATIITRQFVVMRDKTSELHAAMTALVEAYSDSISKRELESVVLSLAHRFGPELAATKEP